MENEKNTGYASIDKPWLKYYSDEAKNDKVPKTNLYLYLKKVSTNRHHLTAINYFGNKISYNKLLDNIDKVSNALQNAGIKNGDLVSICAPSLPEVMYIFFALNKIGAISNMIDPRILPNQIETFVNQSNSKILITLDIINPKIDKIIKNLNVEKIITISANTSLPTIKKIVKTLKDKTNKKIPITFKYINWNKFIDNNNYSLTDSTFLYEKDKSAEIVYTTGTTGTPKGAIMTNDNMLAMSREQLFALPMMTPGEKFLDIMPPFIAYGSMWGMIIPLMAGLEVIMIPKFDSSKFDELLIKYQPPYIMGVPSFYEELLKSQKLHNSDLSFLKCPIAGGNSMTPASEIRVNNFLKEHNCNAKILKGYGMTEVASAISFPVVDEVNKIGSVGIPLSKSTIKVMDSMTGEELKYNEKGELWLSGPTVIKGYLNNDEEQQKTFTVDENGTKWVKSGDIGYIDEDGCVFITGRSKRSIIRPDGHNVYPQEIENVLSEFEAVDTCCVVGAPSLKYENGLIPTAFVVLKDKYKGFEPEIEKKLREYSQQHLQQREIAEEYVFLDKIPLIDGKVDFKKVEKIANDRVEKQKLKKYQK